MNMRQKKTLYIAITVLTFLGVCLWAFAHLPHKGKANEYQKFIDPEGNVLYVNWKNVIEIETAKRVHSLQSKLMLDVSMEAQSIMGQLDSLRDRVKNLEDDLLNLEALVKNEDDEGL